MTTLLAATLAMLADPTISADAMLSDGATDYSPDGWRDAVDEAGPDGREYAYRDGAIYRLSPEGTEESVPVVRVVTRTVATHDLQSGDANEVPASTLCVVVNGGASAPIPVLASLGGTGATEAARTLGAYGVVLMTAGEWARLAPESEAYVLDAASAKEASESARAEGLGITEPRLWWLARLGA